ncbi:MAG: YidC/Oxa1 family membrane protein insertase [Methylophagaceae bacterium]|jgi:YidC/Oxa1 family membrane protein insertase
MDNLKTYLIFGLLIVSLLLWQAWQTDYVQPQQVAQTSNSLVTDLPGTESVKRQGENQQDLPDLPTSPDSLPAMDPSLAASGSNKVHVKTDVIDLYISTQGADIHNLALLNYPIESSNPDIPVQLLSDTASEFFVVQSGLRSNVPAPTHYDQYIADKMQYELGDGQDSIAVPLHWQSADGLKVTKTYHFHRNSYLVEVDYLIENNSGEQFTAYPYSQFNRVRPPKDSGFIYTYTGAVFSSEGNEYDKIDFDDLDDTAFSRKVTNGWTAMIQHYFVAALIPEQNNQENGFYGKSLNEKNYTAGVKITDINVASGDVATSKYSMYLGPKEHKRLEAVVKNLDLTVDYGILTIISQPLFTIMEWIHKLTNNWGWSIVFLTVLIKLAFYKLSAKSYKSMAAMRKLTPKLATLKERHGDDKPAFNKAMMDLYRTEKINPLGGCLPILVQMPVFLSFYWVLVESIELRQAPFIFWLQDLTAMDPYFVLPVLFGLSMFFQQKLNPAPQDPAQAMVMKAFPIVFTVFFAFFPSGLVLYWVVNNALSIAQQWHITRKLGAL